MIVNCLSSLPKRCAHWAALKRYRPDVIVASQSPEFARFRPGRPGPVFTPLDHHRAEKLHPFQRTLIERVFQAPVFETYGSRDALIGAECERHAGLHLSQENLYVGIVDDDGQPTPAGEEGNVVITDLFNLGMPFIRYLNGDRAKAGWTLCAGRGLPLLRQVVGRRLDTLRTPDGRSIPGELFPHLLKDFPLVRRFQVAQPAGTAHAQADCT